MKALVFLDSRDLINCVQYHRPCGYQTLAQELHRDDAAIILTFTNVLESVPRREVEYAVEFARRLGTIPHTFVEHTNISKFEFEEAVSAFEAGRVPSHQLRQAASWPSYICMFAPVEPPPSYVRAAMEAVPFAEQIRALLTDGKGIEFGDVYRKEIAATLQQNRAVLGSKRTSKKVLAELAQMQLHSLGLNVSNFSAFFEWLYGDPSVCPGWRLLNETFEELRTDTSVSLAKGDLPDMTHLYLVPYTKAATLDAKWREYIRRARRRLAAAGILASWPVHADLSTVRSALKGPA